MITTRLQIFAAFMLCGGLFTGCATNTYQAQEIERKHYGDWEKDVGYTQVVRVGSQLHISGIGGKGSTLEEQFQSIYQKTGDILSDYQATTSHIIKEVIYTTDMDALLAIIPVRKGYFKKDTYPSASWVQVERLFSPEMLIEIEFIVQLPSDDAN